MLPSWHNVSSGSSPQPPISESLASPGSKDTCGVQRRLRISPKTELAYMGPSPNQGTDGPICRWALGKLGGAGMRRVPEQTANPELDSPCLRSSSEIWKGLEEDLNQRFLALRSPTVRSHCATNLMAQSHMGLIQGSAWSVEENINPIFLILLWDLSTLTLSHQLWISWAIQDQNHVATPFSS